MSFQSILAGIIQGEASNPADQYGVASVIYNRAAQNYGGYGGAFAQATAPSQFSAYPSALASPTPYASSLASDLLAGNVPGTSTYTAGDTGNALFYNAPGTNPAYASGFGNSYGPGTNQYSDAFNQAPSSSFVLPQAGIDPFPGGTFNGQLGSSDPTQSGSPVEPGPIGSGFGSSAFGPGGTPYGPVGSVDSGSQVGSFTSPGSSGFDPYFNAGQGYTNDPYANTPAGIVQSGTAVTGADAPGQAPNQPGQDISGSPVSSRSVVAGAQDVATGVGGAIQKAANAQITQEAQSSATWLDNIKSFFQRFIFIALGIAIILVALFLFGRHGTIQKAVAASGKAVPVPA